MMRRATETDLPRIKACLEARKELAMFPLSNLARYGFEGEAGYAPFFWVNHGDGPVRDVLCIARNGMVMPYLPSGDFDAALAVLRGQSVIGVIGAMGFARPLVDEMGLAAHPMTLDRDEPHFTLDLADLVMPETSGHLIPLQDMDLATFIDWRTTYHLEALGEAPEKAAEGAERDIATYAANDSHRALIVDGAPVCMTGFNASLPDIVQIGGVFTPVHLRGRGYARAAVALHLVEAQGQGVRQATLFSASDMAARAYRAIGFQEIGKWTLLLTKEPVLV